MKCGKMGEGGRRGEEGEWELGMWGQVEGVDEFPPMG